MSSKHVEERIMRLRLDEAGFKKGIDNISKSLDGFQQKVRNFSSKSFGKTGFEKSIDNLGNSLDSVQKKASAFKFSGLEKTGNVVDRFKDKFHGIGNAINSLGNRREFISMGYGLDSVTKSSNGLQTGLYGVESQTSSLGRGFSILEGVATVALGNIASMGVMKLSNAFKTFTLDPVISGFKEYERELESTRILTTALGQDALPNIKAAMRDLEKYASTTRYNSQDMNTYLARMVNAGVDLETANTVIKGTGNLAASSGASSEGYRNAMSFGLLQAMQMGVMNLQNWRSLEQGNLVSQEFKELLVKIAKEQGTITDDNINSYGFQGLFGDGLAKLDWMTSDVMVEAFEKYANEEKFQKLAANIYTFGEAMQSVGENVNDTWSKVWLEIFGDAEEAKDIWTPFQEHAVNVFDAVGQGALKMAMVFKDMGGLKVVVDSVKTAFFSLKLLFDGVGRAWAKVFPESSVNFVAYFLTVIEDLTRKMTFNAKVGEMTEKIFTAIFTLFKINLGVLSTLGEYIEALIPDGIITNVLYFLAGISDVIVALVKVGDMLVRWMFNLDEMDQKATGVIQVIESFYFAIGELVKVGSEMMMAWAGDLPERVSKILDAFSKGKQPAEGVTTLSLAIQGFLAVMSIAKNILKHLYDGFFSFLSLFQDKGPKTSEGVNAVSGSFKNLVTVLLQSLLKTIIKLAPHINTFIDLVFKLVGFFAKGLVTGVKLILPILSNAAKGILDFGSALMGSFANGIKISTCY